MGMLDEATSGVQIRPQMSVLFGIPGVGKTTWAADFPSPLFLDIEKGSYHLSKVKRITKLPTLEAFQSALKEVKTAKHTHETLVVDSVESLENLICDFVCKEAKVESIELAYGGFGKGFTRVREIGRQIMNELREINESRQMVVLLIGHSQTKTVSDPATNQSYDRIIMRCNDKFAAVIRDLSDNVFFASHKVYTAKDNGKVKAVSEGERVMFTEWRAGFDAKNRMNLPFELPLSYEAFTKAMAAAQPRTTDELRSDIKSLQAGVKDPVILAKVVEATANAKTAEELLTIKNRILAIVQD